MTKKGKDKLISAGMKLMKRQTHSILMDDRGEFDRVILRDPTTTMISMWIMHELMSGALEEYGLHFLVMVKAADSPLLIGDVDLVLGHMRGQGNIPYCINLGGIHDQRRKRAPSKVDSNGSRKDC